MVNPENIDFPDWLKFMNNSFLFHLQHTFEDSFFDLFPPEKQKKLLIIFSARIKKHIDKLCSQDVPDNIEITQTVEFLRYNLSLLDAGGLSMRRSHQDVVICQENQRIIEKIGEDKYNEIVENYEEKSGLRIYGRGERT